ncbi:MAG TPA: ABC transporter permease, partial [Gemmatimonadaceae bacterium]|nr:ABC transporter permease [Gemmatimonadaceae bacterium]
AVILRPLPFPHSDRLVRIYDDLAGAGAKDVGMSVPELADLKQAGVFEDITVIFPASTALAGGDRVERIELMATTPNYFEFLGAKAAHGRVYGTADGVPGFSDGVVISDGLWKRQFGGDPNVIGKKIRVDEDPYTIIGVMPPDFRHPGNTVSGDVDIWGACGFIAAPFPDPPVRAARVLPGAMGRLKPGVTAAQAQAKLNALTANLRQQYPNDYPDNLKWSVRLQSAQESLTGNVKPTLLILLTAVGFVLLLVCVNLAGLLLARFSSRASEFALRQALGATPRRLARQVLTESALISVAGGVVALVILRALRTPLVSLMPADIPRTTEIGADWRLVIIALLTSVMTGLLVGIIPALHAAKVEPHDQLKEGGRSGSALSKRQGRSRAALVVVEVALSVVLLTAAGLQVRSFAAVIGENPGVNPEHLIVGQVWVPVPNNPSANPYITPVARTNLMRGLLEQLALMPGIESASLGGTSDIPFLNSVNRTFPFALPDEPASQEGNRAAQFGTVSANYFATMGTALKSGRVFSDHDDPQSPLVAIVNEAFVRTFAPKGDLVGHRLRLGRNTDFQIVGVVGDVRTNGLDVPAPPRIYTSILQRPTITLAVFVRTKAGTRETESGINKLVHTVDPELPVFGVRTMDDVMSRSMERRTFSLYLIAAFGIAALLLAVLGIYGVMSLLVSQRASEYAVRMALGARPRDILGLAFRPGLRLAGLGTAIGLVAALGVGSWMAALIYGVSARDPVTLAAVAVILPLAATVACLVPAARAMRVPLLDVLKS